jgi:hypothetical protein
MVTKAFKRSGVMQLPGSFIEDIPASKLTELAGYIRVEGFADSYPEPDHPVWLEGDELRTTGVLEDLAREIVRLTADNHPLQVKLLRQHCPTSDAYKKWIEAIRSWRHRAAQLFEQEGYDLYEADWLAAQEHNLTDLAEELSLKGPELQKTKSKTHENRFSEMDPYQGIA